MKMLNCEIDPEGTCHIIVYLYDHPLGDKEIGGRGGGGVVIIIILIMRSAVDIICSNHLWSSAVEIIFEIICQDQLLRLSVKISC